MSVLVTQKAPEFSAQAVMPDSRFRKAGLLERLQKLSMSVPLLLAARLHLRLPHWSLHLVIEPRIRKTLELRCECVH